MLPNLWGQGPVVVIVSSSSLTAEVSFGGCRFIDGPGDAGRAVDSSGSTLPGQRATSWTVTTNVGVR